MRRRNQAVLLVALFAAALLVVWLRPGSGETGDAALATVAREDFRVMVEANGKFEAAVAYEIGPPSVEDTWQYNLTWMVGEGTKARKGMPVVRFDATTIDDRLREYEATLETTVQEREKEERNLEISLRQLHLDLVKAESELKTVELQLSGPEELLPPLEREQLGLRRDLARKRYDFLSEKIEFEQELVKQKLVLLDVKREFAEGKIAFYESVKDAHNVKAPVSGLVVYIPKRNGDRYERGESVFMMSKILKVADVSTLRIEASVLEVDAALVAPGQQAEVTVDAIPGLVLPTAVEEVGRIIRERSMQDRSKVFDIILPIGEDADRDSLKPGMGVKVAIETARLPDRLTVPVQAVQNAADGFHVEMASGERRAVVPGPRNRERVVIEEGLEEGERVRLSAGDVSA